MATYVVFFIFYFPCLTFIFGFTDLSSKNQHKLLMISLDGFRWDYLHKTDHIPNFQRMINEGAWATKGLKNSFLTKTFPNHYTLVTGLYEESHGIVGNIMYDPVLNETFHIANKSQANAERWFDDGGEPIWVTNQRQSTEHRSGVVFWPGNGAPVKGILPYKRLPYDQTMPFSKRVDTIVSWFTDEYPINLGLMYYHEPDESGHEVGPDSPEIVKMIEKLDSDIGYLFEQLEAKELLPNMNIILTSDHGMTTTPQNDTTYKIDLDKYIDVNSYFITSSNPVAALRPKSEDLGKEILKNLTGLPHAYVYKKQDIPDQYHYKHNRRVEPILIAAEEHYWISHNGSNGTAGQHGYNNSLPSMHPVFLAMGPSFKAGARVEIFNNEDVYPLMCKLLNLKPAPNNGSLVVAGKLLIDLELEEDETSVFGIYIFILLFTGLVSSIFSIAACLAHRRFKRRQLYMHSIPGEVPINLHFTDIVRAPLLSESGDDGFD